MDFIRPIGPVDRDVDPVLRVERKRDEDHDEPPRREPQRRPRPAAPAPASEPEQGPVEGDDGHMHVDIRA